MKEEFVVKIYEAVYLIDWLDTLSYSQRNKFYKEVNKRRKAKK